MMSGVPLGVPTLRRVVGLFLIWNRFDSTKTKTKTNYHDGWWAVNFAYLFSCRVYLS